MSEAVIRVSAELYDRLVALAESRGTTVTALLSEFAASASADTERRRTAEAARAHLAECFGIEVTDEESAAMGRKLREAFDRQR
ncbi:hypothetical protein AB0G74_26205 [Streptomyces sp. NPDC020875]|uniref:hypothetical protein n=1 Tax=Streptomyces sp. NPDC020875 TaxID=3154898 RepID=UPI0033CC42E3